ncbi:MAG: aspartate/glutamate racemase family protein [Pseudomonadota bacterium]
MHIGLIGGIGVAATLVYYKRLTAAIAAKGAPVELTIVHAEASTLIANNLADKREDQAQVFARLIDRLRAAGCDCAAITSLGGHFCYAETAAISSLPLVSGVTPLDAHFAAQRIDTIGLLGTKVVMETRLYSQLEKTRAVVPEADLATVGQNYLDMATSGECSEEQRAFFFAHGRKMMADQGADAILLAGTDLGLAFDGFDPGYPVIDALDVHVDLLARLAAGEAKLE